MASKGRYFAVWMVFDYLKIASSTAVKNVFTSLRWPFVCLFKLFCFLCFTFFFNKCSFFLWCSFFLICLTFQLGTLWIDHQFSQQIHLRDRIHAPLRTWTETRCCSAAGLMIKAATNMKTARRIIDQKREGLIARGTTAATTAVEEMAAKGQKGLASLEEQPDAINESKISSVRKAAHLQSAKWTYRIDTCRHLSWLACSANVPADSGVSNQESSV